MNWDKGAENVFGFTADYDVECWEFKNNTSDPCLFTGTIASKWDEDFEARYPDGYGDISRFKEMHDWVVSTKQSGATGYALAEPYIDIDENTHTNDTAAYRLAKFKTEFEDHFNMHYSLIYYVYTFFALMTDQRAKNMFLTYWGNTGKWYPYFYDNDTSFGINNEGGLVFSYYHEDSDQLDGANVYNGQLSTLWINFRQAFADEIKETYQNLRSNSILNYDELVNQFIVQGSDKWSESIYNEDQDFKYVSMLRSDNDATNLPQVRGTGEEHFRYFVENRLNYCDSKWYAGDYPEDNAIVRIYTPVNAEGVPRTDLVIPANADITVTPYSAMYAGVRYKANGTLYQERLEENETYTFEAPDEIFNDTETAIYGASQLSSLGDLAPLYLGYIDVGAATKLVELKIGDGTPGYLNSNLYHLAVGTNRLLKKIDIQNCAGPKFSQALVLTGCPNIEEVYAKGSSITGVDLPDSGYLKVLQLPATIANLTLKNQPYLEDLTIEGLTNLKTITIENTPVDTLSILSGATNVERVRLTNVDWHHEDASILYELIERNLAGIDENGTNTDTMWIDGKCHIKALTGDEYAEIKSLYPYLEITYDTLTSQLIFMSEDGETELTRQTIYDGGDGTCPVESGEFETPTKESTAQYNFTFGGWSLTPGGDPDPNALLKVEGDRYVYLSYYKEVRTYTVKFYNGTTLLYSVVVEYGDDAVYTGATPNGGADYLTFIGWSPEPTNIQSDIDCYAQYYDTRVIEDDWAAIATACADGTYLTKYDIGASKPVEITYEDGTSETINFELIAKDHDELTDGSSRINDITRSFGNGNSLYLRGEIVVYNSKLHTIVFNSTTHTTFDGSTIETLQPMPVSFSYNYYKAVVYNNEIHVIGVISDGILAHYKYDGSTWSHVCTPVFVNGPSKLSLSVYGMDLIVWNGVMYKIGGNGDKTIYKYDQTNNEWSPALTSTIDLFHCKAVVYNDELHVLCKTNHYKFNGDTCEYVSTIPYDFNQGGAVVFHNKIHIFGGVGNTSAHYTFDGVEWVDVGSLPSTVSIVNHANALVYNESIYFNTTGGGLYNGRIYQWVEKKWVDLFPNRTSGLYNRKLIVYNNELYSRYQNGAYQLVDFSHYMGGGTDLGQTGGNNNKETIFNGELHVISCVSASVDYGHMKYDVTEGAFVQASTLPDGFNQYGCGFVTYKDKIYAFSGNSKKYYTWDGTSWSDAYTTPSTYYHGRYVVYNDELHILMNGATCNYHFKFDGDTWTKLGSLSWSSSVTHLIEFQNELYALGGLTGYERIIYKFNGTEWVDTGMSTPGAITNSAHVCVYRNKIHISGIFIDGATKQQQTYVRLENPKAPLTFLAKNLLKNDENMKVVNFRANLSDMALEKLPVEIRNVIQPVKKPWTFVYSSGGDIIREEYDAKVWIPSEEEVGCDKANQGLGEPYSVFTDNTSRIKYRVGESEPSMYPLRNISGYYSGYWINKLGMSTKNSINGVSPYLPGFCIGGNGGASDV